jgi:uncharacterized protein YoxC
MNWEKKFTHFIGSKASVILHTIFFIFMFALPFLGVDLNTMLLILTTLVSLEAIYLAIFIQMTVNKNTASLKEVEEDIEDIQEDVGEIQHDVDEIQEDVDEIQEDVDEISVDIGEIESDIDEMQSDTSHGTVRVSEKISSDSGDLDRIQSMLQQLMEEVENLKRK